MFAIFAVIKYLPGLTGQPRSNPCASRETAVQVSRPGGSRGSLQGSRPCPQARACPLEPGALLAERRPGPAGAGQLSTTGPPRRPRAAGVSVRPPQVRVGRCRLLPGTRERAAGARVHPGLPLSCNRPNWAAPVSAAGTQTHGRGTPGTVGQGPGAGGYSRYQAPKDRVTRPRDPCVRKSQAAHGIWDRK